MARGHGPTHLSAAPARAGADGPDERPQFERDKEEHRGVAAHAEPSGHRTRRVAGRVRLGDRHRIQPARSPEPLAVVARQVHGLIECDRGVQQAGRRGEDRRGREGKLAEILPVADLHRLGEGQPRRAERLLHQLGAVEPVVVGPEPPVERDLGLEHAPAVGERARDVAPLFGLQPLEAEGADVVRDPEGEGQALDARCGAIVDDGLAALDGDDGRMREAAARVRAMNRLRGKKPQRTRMSPRRKTTSPSRSCPRPQRSQAFITGSVYTTV